MSTDLYDFEIISGTVDPSSSIVYEGSKSLRLVGATGHVRQRISLEHELAGQSITLTARGRTETGADGVGKIGLTVNGTTSYSSLVTANSTWQLLTVAGTPSTDAIQPIYVSLHSGHASYPVYFDSIQLKLTNGNAVYILPISEAFKAISQVWRRTSGDPLVATSLTGNLPFDATIRPPETVVNGYGRYSEPFLSNTPIKIIGSGVWPNVSALTDTVDIGIDEAPLVALRAAQYILRRAKAADYLSAKEHWVMMEQDLAGDTRTIVSSLRDVPETLRLPIKR